MFLKIKFLLLLCFLSCYSFASIDDSIGVILKNNKVFIIHKVEKGQGLYGIARRYKTVWTQIRDANPSSSEMLIIGQILLVPTEKTEKEFFGNKTPKYSKFKGEYIKPVKTKPAKVEKIVDNTSAESTSNTSFTFKYKVKKGETLFSIAQKFATTVDFLKQLNKLKEENIHEEIEILVPIIDDAMANSIEKKEAAESNKIALDDLKKSTSKIKEEEKKEVVDTVDLHQNLPAVTEPKKERIEIPGYTITTENFPEYNVEKITETGFGKVMNDKKTNQTKDLIFHHNAPENTIILITNPANNKTIYARVVKNFNRDENDPVIIYLTKSTAEYLELNKKDKFAIKISFAR